jgi:hypothetical protein
LEIINGILLYFIVLFPVKGIGYLELVRMWVLENLSKTKAA